MKFLPLFCILLTSCGDAHRIGSNPLETTNNGSGVSCELLFKSENLCLEAIWDVMPSNEMVGSMILTFSNKDRRGSLKSPTNPPLLFLYMPSMGHGSSPVTMSLIEEGRYRADDVYFIMPGPWELRFQLRDPENHVVDEVIQKITI